jgi:predicted HAD superfamily Cof-like phosphohydrolase
MSKPSQYSRVYEFNRVFGNPVTNIPDAKSFTNDNPIVSQCMGLITEEYNELMDAVKKNDMVEATDALADLLVVINGMGSRLGINLDTAFDIVHASNMSKLCNSEKEAMDTVEYYKTSETRYDSPYYYAVETDDGVKYVVRNKSTNKILKNVNYTPANFSTMF